MRTKIGRIDFRHRVNQGAQTLVWNGFVHQWATHLLRGLYLFRTYNDFGHDIFDHQRM